MVIGPKICNGSFVELKYPKLKYIVWLPNKTGIDF